MRNLLVGLLFLTSGMVMGETATNDDLMELDEPYKYIGGAYVGFSTGPTFMSYKLNGDNESTGGHLYNNSSKTQWDLAVLGGFGASFYKDYYIGLEMEIMKRFGQSTKFKDDTDVLGVKFNSQFGINMNLRFGYLFPKQGNMVYVLVGFSRTLGRVVEKLPNNSGTCEKSFGSYFPVVGMGFEHKISYNWNVRADVKYSITTDESDSRVHDDSKWEYKVKPQSIGVRFYITRNM